MENKLLNITLNTFPKSGFHESQILSFKTKENMLIIKILTSPFYNKSLTDKNLLSFLNNLNKDALVLELTIENPKYEFLNYYSFFDYKDSDIDLIEIKNKGKIIGYSLVMLGFYDEEINSTNSQYLDSLNPFLNVNLFGSSFKWTLIGQVTNMSFNSSELKKLNQIYDD